MSEDGEFEEFFQANYRRLVALLVGMVGNVDDAEDIAQEAFSRILARWPRLSQYEAPEAWVRKVAIRLAIDSRRKLVRAIKLRTRLVGTGSNQSAPTVPLAATPLGEALTRLPARQRQVVVLHYIADMSVEAISTEYGMPLGTVKGRLAAGKRRLEDNLRKHMEAISDGR